jgi:hypothetical protein
MSLLRIFYSYGDIASDKSTESNVDFVTYVYDGFTLHGMFADCIGLFIEQCDSMEECTTCVMLFQLVIRRDHVDWYVYSLKTCDHFDWCVCRSVGQHGGVHVSDSPQQLQWSILSSCVCPPYRELPAGSAGQ